MKTIQIAKSLLALAAVTSTFFPIQKSFAQSLQQQFNSTKSAKTSAGQNCKWRWLGTVMGRKALFCVYGGNVYVTRNGRTFDLAAPFGKRFEISTYGSTRVEGEYAIENGSLVSYTCVLENYWSNKTCYGGAPQRTVIPPVPNQ